MVSRAGAVSVAYDAIAPTYDERLSGDFWVRLILWDHYERAFKPGATVLDAGCGTGIDSRFLAGLGVTVLAADASPGMLAQLTPADNGSVHPLLFDVNAAGVARAGSLDGMVMAFASFNTVEDPARFAVAAASLLRPGGRLIIHALGRHSLWDVLPHLLRGRVGRVRRVLNRTALTVTIGATSVRHRLVDADLLYRRAFAAEFDLVSSRGIGALRPPATARLPWAVAAALEGLEARFGAGRLFRDWGRFVLLDLRRRPPLSGIR